MEKRMIDKKTISIVVPAYNEEEALAEFHRRISMVLDQLPMQGEVIYVNDGSSDGTLKIMRSLQSADKRVLIIDLSRNYGKEIALTAGLDYAKGEAVIPIDADLQDPPELVPDLVDKWREGYDVVYARRISRAGESWIKKTTAASFYKVMEVIGGKVVIPANVGDFRLLDRKALDALKQFREHHRFMKGLFATIGFRQTALDYHRDSRFAGNTKWSYWKLWNFSLEGITSFTIAPLKMSTYIGLSTAVFSFSYGLFIFAKALLVGDPVPGFPSLMVMIAFLGGIQLTVLGIIGEYLGRIFNETKNRPLYFVQDVYPLDDEQRTDSAA
jgi:glycosyltransferase involved in cell wall biosynthesis